MSGPLLDRIDVQVVVPAVRTGELTSRKLGESSTSIRARIIEARDRQLRRFAGRQTLFANAHMTPRDVHDHCEVDERGEELLRAAIQRLGLSARAYHRVLRLARTIADLERMDSIAAAHVAEAIQYRSLDRRRPHVVVS